jgi:hypothetical protein
MANQEVKNIKIKDLVLWTENPRDPIDKNATAQDILDVALSTRSSKWELSKLAKEMGAYFDLSEIPTVVLHDDIPVVDDGNRRVILAKLKLGLVKMDNAFVLPDFPDEIPCNVCTKDIAIKNIWRKHRNNNAWDWLERDIFLHKHMGEDKSLFLLLDEQTGLISNNPHLNQRFVKEEIFNDENLKKLGFSFVDRQLNSKHKNDDANSILTDISNQVKSKKISTRLNRGDVVGVLEPSSQELIDLNKSNKLHPLDSSFKSNFTQDNTKKFRQAKRVKTKGHEFFGGVLYLKSGDVSNLYKDLSDLYTYYVKNKDRLSESFVRLVRKALRLLCELAAKDGRHTIDAYIKKYFAKAKSNLDQDATTTLSTQSVNENSIIQLMHIGAHNYQASSNAEQTLAMSIILGAMLTVSHGQDSTK